MAVIPYVLIEQVENSASTNGTISVAWPDMQSGDVGQPYSGHSYADRSIQVVGVFSAATCRVAGSNGGDTYTALSDPQGDALNLATAGLKAVSEITRFLRPEVLGGDGATSLTVTMIARR